MPENSVARNNGHTDIAHQESSASYTTRAAELTKIEPTLPVTAPGSRRDFLQAMLLLDSGLSVGRIQAKRSLFEVMPVHLSCPRETWAEVFGEMQGADAQESAADRPAVQVWEHHCTDGPVTCIGHLFERSPGVGWVVVVRVCLPKAAA